MIVTAIRTKLLTNSTLVGYLGKEMIDSFDNALVDANDEPYIVSNDIKVFPLTGNQKSLYPQVVINPGYIPVDCHEGYDKEWDIQLDIYDHDYDMVNNIETQVVSTLEGITQGETISTLVFNIVKLESKSEDYDSEDELYRSILKFKITTNAN